MCSSGNSLAVQWLGLGAVTAGPGVQSLVRELRSRKPCSSAKKKKKKEKEEEEKYSSSSAHDSPLQPSKGEMQKKKGFMNNVL